MGDGAGKDETGDSRLRLDSWFLDGQADSDAQLAAPDSPRNADVGTGAVSSDGADAETDAEAMTSREASIGGDGGARAEADADAQAVVPEPPVGRGTGAGTGASSLAADSEGIESPAGRETAVGVDAEAAVDPGVVAGSKAGASAAVGAVARSATGAGAHRARYRRILSFAARVFVQTWWYELVLPRIGMQRTADRTRDRRMIRAAQRFRVLAVDLGGLMIKVGQFLSARLDVLPPEVTDELSGLQDEVPAVPFPEIRALAEAELGVPLERAYAWFDEAPVAAASLGQAHRARLSPEDATDAGFADVVVKVQRPGIDDIFAIDLAALRRIGGWLRRVRLVSDRVDAPALVEEFAQICHEEIDYLHEAAGAERFAEMTADDPRVAAPAIAWERTTRRVLTLSDVTAIKIADVEALRAAGIDPHEVAAVFADVMLDQVFTHGFFHGDPHPGNLFVTPGGSDDGPAWRLTFVDFGMMGEVPRGIRDGLRTLIIAVAARDSRGLVRAAQQIGVLLPSANTVELERALTALFERFGGMGFAELKDVDPRELNAFAEEFGDTVRSLPVQLPEKLLLLFRAVALTSGMCSNLDPGFNIWDPVEPYAARLLRDESGGIVQDLATQAASGIRLLWGMPQRVDSALTRLDEGALTFDTSRLERRVDRLIGVGRRVVSAVLFMALLVGGILLLTHVPWLGIVFMSASALPFLHAVFGGRRGQT